MSLFFRVLSRLFSSAATAIQCLGSSPKSIARFPARIGLSLPVLLASVIVLGRVLYVLAHSDADCFLSAFVMSSLVLSFMCFPFVKWIVNFKVLM